MDMDQIFGGALVGLSVLVILAFVAHVLWSEQRTRRAWRIEQARSDENARTLAYIADVDPAAFAWREVQR